MSKENNMDHIQYTLAPLKYFYLICTTVAALFDNRLLRCTWYRIYITIIFLVPFLVISYVYYLTFDRIKLSPFNFSTIYIYYLVLQYGLMMHPMLSAKKMRVNKVVRALADLDSEMRFENFEACTKLRKRIVLWLVLLFTSHGVVYGVLVFLLLQLTAGANIVTISVWFKFLELAMDMELTCVSCFACLLYYRARAFLQHLEQILHSQVTSDLNLLLCHRQLHYVLKKINKAWKFQMSVTLSIMTFQALRNLITICIHLNQVAVTAVCALLFVRYLTVFLPLCVVGQRLANMFDRIHVTAGIMRDSGDELSSAFVRSGSCMSSEGALRERRLRCWCALDLTLPPRLLASIGGLLVIILQLRVDLTAYDM